jgi:DNA helicase II / ATP-dependent DNA helicase PcrA
VLTAARVSGDDFDFDVDSFEEESDPLQASIDELNPPQAEAASHVDGPLVVFAGAGSGKTRVITYRIANLLAVHRVPPYRVLAVTFTNKAAGEMRHRLESLVGPELARDLWVGTFHATCARLLRRHHEAAGLGKSFVVYDDADQRAVMNRVFKALGIDDKRYPLRQVLGRIHKEKQEGVTAAEFVPGGFVDDVVARCFHAYEAHLAQANAVDFDDLLLRVLRLLENPTSEAGEELRRKFRYVLVDEFQDVNQVQYRLVRAFAAATRNLCVVGDDDQSIYRWRGADVRIVRNFSRDFEGTKVVKLEQNYRSTGNVVAAALGVIGRARDRIPKELWTQNSPGRPVSVVQTASERDEAAFVAEQVRALVRDDVSPSQIAVFYRVHAQSRVLEEVMRAERLPYQVIGGTKFFDRAEVKDLLSYLRLVDNPQSDVDLLRVINVPPRKIGATTVEKIVAEADRTGRPLTETIPAVLETNIVGSAGKKALASFVKLVDSLRARAATAPPSELARDLVTESGYRDWLVADDSAESDARLQNLEELVGSIAEYEAEIAAAGELPTLSGYLERVSLTAMTDELKDQPKISMMTVHAAKGLEFDFVFITGMEEDTFPFRSQDPSRDDDDEEERRLAYVAITRARTQLWVTHAERRSIFGTTRYGLPSRFIADMPRAAVQHDKTEASQSSEGRFIDREGWAFGPRRDDGRPAAPKLAWSRPTPEPRQAGERFVEAEDETSSSSFGRRRQVELDPAELPEHTTPATKLPPGSIGRGTRVAHKSFGVGVVLELDEGDDPTATVRFTGWTPKRIKLRFLHVAE